MHVSEDTHTLPLPSEAMLLTWSPPFHSVLTSVTGALLLARFRGGIAAPRAETRRVGKPQVADYLD